MQTERRTKQTCLFFMPRWVFQAFGTGCFRPWNWVFQALKLSVCRSFVLDVVPTYPVNGGCMRGMHQ